MEELLVGAGRDVVGAVHASEQDAGQVLQPQQAGNLANRIPGNRGWLGHFGAFIQGFRVQGQLVMPLPGCPPGNVQKALSMHGSASRKRSQLPFTIPTTHSFQPVLHKVVDGEGGREGTGEAWGPVKQ